MARDAPARGGRGTGRGTALAIRGLVVPRSLLEDALFRPPSSPAAFDAAFERPRSEPEPEPGAAETDADPAARLETELMLRFQATGNSADFESLYAAARGPLLLWVVSLACTRRAGVEPTELLQDAFVNIYRYAASFRASGPRSFRVWSRTIAGNLLRRSRHERRRAFQELPEGSLEPRDRGPGPAAGLVEGEERLSLLRAWILLLARYAAAYERLGERDRAALHLVEVEGASYQEACARLGVGLSNLKMILFRARRRIRASIAADLGLPLARAADRRPARLRRAG